MASIQSTHDLTLRVMSALDVSLGEEENDQQEEAGHDLEREGQGSG